LIGAFGRDSVSPSAWRRVIRCGPGSGGTAGGTISSGPGSTRSTTSITRLAKLGRAIDWRFLEARFSAVYSDKAGHPPLPTRLMAGLSILKHMHDLSDEDLCARWVENPYFQLFCGEEFFQHKLTFDRSSLTRWRQRMGEEKLVALIQESLSVATRAGAAKPADFSKVIVDTTCSPRRSPFRPTPSSCIGRASGW
jgi:IS5 family transposase